MISPSSASGQSLQGILPKSSGNGNELTSGDAGEG